MLSQQIVQKFEEMSSQEVENGVGQHFGVFGAAARRNLPRAALV